jgi:hypothetical protein
MIMSKMRLRTTLFDENQQHQEDLKECEVNPDLEQRREMEKD